MSQRWQLTTAEKAPSQLERLLEQSLREAEIAAFYGGAFKRSSEISSDYALREVHYNLSLAVSR